MIPRPGPNGEALPGVGKVRRDYLTLDLTHICAGEWQGSSDICNVHDIIYICIYIYDIYCS